MKKNYKEYDREPERGKRKYIERRIEEEEAEEQIRDFEKILPSEQNKDSGISEILPNRESGKNFS